MDTSNPTGDFFLDALRHTNLACYVVPEQDSTATPKTPPPAPHPIDALPINDPDDAPIIRKLLCITYEDCLDVAIQKQWLGFACAKCTAFVRISVDQMMQDQEGLINLLAEVAATRRSDLHRERYFHPHVPRDPPTGY